MMYAEGLRKLRKPQKTDFIGKPQATKSSRSSLIPSRQEEPVQEQDPLASYREFADFFRSVVDEQRGKNKAQVQKLVRESEPKAGTEKPEEKLQLVPKRERDKEQEKSSPLGEGSPVDFIGTASSKDWLGIIDKTEGGGNYSTLFGHSQSAGGPFSGVDVSKMTIGELKQFTRPDGPYASWVKSQVGRVATPMGRYQFVGSTMEKVAAEMGLPDNTVFDQKTQDAMFEYYLKKRISMGSTMPEKIAQVRQAWEGFKNVPSMELARLIRKTDETGLA